MKKIRISMVLLIGLLVFSGCGQSKQGSDKEKTSESTEETTSSTTKNSHRKTKKEREAAKKSRELDKAEREETERREKEEERKARSAQSAQGSGDGVITADVPDFSSITKAEVVAKLGEPDEKVTNQEDIVAMLEVEGPEVQLAITMRDAGELDQEEARGFAFGAADIGMAMRMGLKIECYVYNDESKPNVYFEGDEIKFMSANTPFEWE